MEKDAMKNELVLVGISEILGEIRDQQSGIMEAMFTEAVDKVGQALECLSQSNDEAEESEKEPKMEVMDYECRKCDDPKRCFIEGATLMPPTCIYGSTPGDWKEITADEEEHEWFCKNCSQNCSLTMEKLLDGGSPDFCVNNANDTLWQNTGGDNG